MAKPSGQPPDQPLVQVSGVVTNVQAVSEGARFVSDVYLILQGGLPRDLRDRRVTLTKVEPEVYVPGQRCPRADAPRASSG